MNMEGFDEGALSAPQDKLILIAEDDTSIREFLQTIIQSEGFQVATAENGTETLRKISERLPDLIITDLMMPGQGGFEVLRELQLSEKGRSIPVIVVTASKLDPSTVQMIRKESNVLEFIPKPIQINVLLASLHRHLKTLPPQLRKR